MRFFLSTLRRQVAVHRRLIATLAAMLSVAAIASGHDQTTVKVVAAVHRIEAGQRLVAGDLKMIAVPATAVPEGALTEIAAATDQLAAAVVPRGAIVTADTFTAAQKISREGRLIVPIPLTQPELADLLQPGTAVSLIVADGYGQTTVIDDVTIVDLPAAESGSLFGASGASYILVDVPEETATLLATTTASVTIGLR